MYPIFIKLISTRWI